MNQSKSIDERKSSLALPKEVWIGWIASLTEAYNTAIYTFVAPFLAKRIFHHEDVWSSIFFSFCLIFVGSCLFYPAGATYFGYIGDKRGRNKTCIYSTFGLAIATGMMGLTPMHLLADKAWIWFLILICAQYFFQGESTADLLFFRLSIQRGKKAG